MINKAVRAQKWRHVCCALLLAGFGLASFQLSAQESDIKFHHLSREGGLSQSFILSIVQDREGFIWVATQSGLNRFDGYEVRSFTKSDANNSLPDNTVRTLLVDREGNLWLGTDNGGMAQFRFETETFTVYNNQNSELPTNRIRTLFEDAAGRIWVGTDGAGLWRFDPKRKQFTSASAAPSEASVWSISDSVSGQLLVGTTEGLFEFDPSSAETSNTRRDLRAVEFSNSNMNNLHVRSILEEMDGTLWLGTQTQGVYRKELKGDWQQFTPDTPGASISGPQVARIFQDGRGDIWLATSGGLDHFSKGSLISHRADPAKPYSLSSDIVLDIYQDRSGVMWIATFGGVNYWSRNEYRAGHQTSNPRSFNSLSSPAVTALEEAQDGTRWVGTFGGGLNQIMPNGIIRHHRPSAQDDASLPEDHVMSLAVDNLDRLWVGTRGSGLVLFDAEKGVLKQFHQGGEAGLSLSSNAITSIAETSTGHLLVGTYGGGMNRIGIHSLLVEPIEPVATDIKGHALQSDRVMSVYEDRQQRIWLGTDGAGLALFDPETGHYRHFMDQTSSGFDANIVLTIAEDSKGNLYFGTLANGLFRLPADDTDFQFEQLTMADGLASDSVYGLLVDDFDLVWLSSNAGVSRFDPFDNSVYHLGLKNGLQDLEFNSGAVFKTSSGDLLFGGVNGFNTISPDLVQKNTVPPPVVITSAARQGVRFEPAAKAIELSYKDYVLEFQFAALDFTNPSANQYRYRLLGLENKWVSAGNRRYASYTNLDQGSYTFEVIAANSDGVWSPEPARMSVTVSPAPWFSWFAYVCYGALILLLIVLILRAQRIRLNHVAEVQAINHRLRLEVEARKEKEIEINVEKSRTQRYLDVAEVALVALDVEGSVLHVNYKAAHVFGDLESTVGANLLDFVSPSQRNELRQKILSVFDGEDDGRHFECEMQDRNEQSHTVMWRFAQLSETGGHANIILASGTDITQLRELEKSVRLKEKLSALGTLSAGIAHDFNNILTAIMGYSNLALNEVRGMGDVEGFVEKIEAASIRATDLVAKILSVTQIDERNFIPVEVNSVLAKAIDKIESDSPAEIRIQSEISDDIIMVSGDATQLGQLVSNLTKNAIAAMRGGGQLTIKLSRRVFEEEEVEAGANVSAGQYALLEIEDTGSGMPDSVKQKIFDPFYSADTLGVGERVGTGLGLSIVHGIVLAHRGEIIVDSEMGSGTKFQIYLPECEPIAKAKVVSLPSAKVPKKRIMLVDDEEWIVDVTSRLLNSLGFDIEAFTAPLEGLERFRAAPEEFELIITDQNMPQVKGTEFIAAAKQVREDIRIILMSGNVSPLKQHDTSAVFLPKPFKLKDLREALFASGFGSAASEIENKSS